MTQTSQQERHQARYQARQTILMEQYKVVRETIVLLVQDRIANNRLILAISTVILGGEGFIIKDILPIGAGSLSLTATVLLFAAALVGARLSFLWHRWNFSYKTSLKVRYELLREIEVLLPKKPFARELELRNDFGYVKVSDVIADLASLFFCGFALQLPPLAYWFASRYGG